MQASGQPLLPIEPAPASTLGEAKVQAAQGTPNLGDRTLRGFLWVLASSGGVKAVTLLAQLLLARLLLPADYGLVALAYTVTTFTGILQRDGLRDVLVQRAYRFDHYANAAFWMSLATGLVVGVLTAAAGPVAAGIYRQPQLTGLLMILACGAVIQSLESVPGASIQKDLRFGLLSAQAMFEGLATALLTIVFALSGWGAYSIVAPVPIVGLASLVWLWRASGFRPRRAAQWQLWRELFASTSLLLGAAALYAFNQQGASIVLGLVADVSVVGLYFFAFNLTAQLTGFLTNNLWAVLLPSFSHLQDDLPRQTVAFLRVTRAVNLVGMFICFGLAACADPALRLVYGARWVPAIPLVQIISVGMAFSISFAVSVNLMMAQGRYRALLYFNVFRAAGYIALVGVGGWWGGALAVSVGTALYMLIFGPWITRLAIRPGGRSWGDVWAAHFRPVLAGALPCLLAAAVTGLLPDPWSRPLPKLLLVVGIASASYLPLAFWLDGTTSRELYVRVRGLLFARAKRG